MQKIKVIQTLPIAGGQVALTERQVEHRAHCLSKSKSQPKELDKEFTAFDVIAPVQFKAGEELYLDVVPKTTNPFIDAGADDSEDADESGNGKKKG